MSEQHDTIRAIQWQDDHLLLLDQRRLPHEESWLSCRNITQTADAIRQMVVRGAPAIGITAAYGIVMAARHHYQQDANNWKSALAEDLQTLAQARPTAVNLAWAIHRMQSVIDAVQGDPFEPLLNAARQIHEADLQANLKMGAYGASLIKDKLSRSVITHCNTGSLATGGYGTALGVIRHAFADGKISQVYAGETRPWFQGARLTAWELIHDDIPVQLFTEGAAASLMKQQRPGWVIVGADRVAANGDVANKIGTYNLAVLARQHGVKFMVVAPWSTVDMQIETGDDIPIEFREQQEVLQWGNERFAPTRAQAWNPVFDVTPASLIDAFVSERGIIEQPNAQKMLAMSKKS